MDSQTMSATGLQLISLCAPKYRQILKYLVMPLALACGVYHLQLFSCFLSRPNAQQSPQILRKRVRASRGPAFSNFSVHAMSGAPAEDLFILEQTYLSYGRVPPKLQQLICVRKQCSPYKERLLSSYQRAPKQHGEGLKNITIGVS